MAPKIIQLEPQGFGYNYLGWQRVGWGRHENGYQLAGLQ